MSVPKVTSPILLAAKKLSFPLTGYVHITRKATLPLGIEPTSFITAALLSVILLISCLAYGVSQNKSVLQNHLESLAYTSIYIERAIREGEIIALPASQREEETSSQKENISPERIYKSLKAKDVYKETPEGVMPFTINGKTVFKKFQKRSVYPQSLMDDNTAPKISLILLNAGLKPNTLTEVVSQLPPAISLAFSPYAQNIPQMTRLAFAQGFESWVMFHNETSQFPLDDPGPLVFLRNVNPRQNLERLKEVVIDKPYIIGFVGMPEGLGLYAEQERETLSRFLKQTGMGYIHDRRFNALKRYFNETNIPYGHSQLSIDTVPTKSSIRQNLERLVSLSQANGSVTAFFEGYPITIKEIKLWSETLKARGVKLVPASQNMAQ